MFALSLATIFTFCYFVFQYLPLNYHSTNLVRGGEMFGPILAKPAKRQPVKGLHYPSLILSLTFVGVTFLISGARIFQIKQGGATYLPSLLKAVPLGDEIIFASPEGQRQEKTLRNVVSELSVVAGVQEPDVYVLPTEETINAMASGLDPDDSSILVTKGCLKYLNREELMALMAHEFSHLINGDTKHFTTMSGWLHGLMFMKSAGFKIVSNYPHAFFIVLAMAISLIGTIGNVAGKLIQAAFSRTRERLADQTSAQFTRDPMALATVLKKIGGQGPPTRISKLRHPELAHLYVSEPQSFWEQIKAPQALLKIFSSHPPLEERIWELDPDWDGWYWDFDKNPVDYLTQSRPAPEQTKPQTSKTRSVLIPML
jgi:Zn-dependent protease with chaperone function